MLEQFSSYIFEQYQPTIRVNSRKNSRTSITSGGDQQEPHYSILREIVSKAMMHDERFEDLKLIKLIRKLWKEEIDPLIALKLKEHLASTNPNLLALYLENSDSPSLLEEKIKVAFDSVVATITSSQEYTDFSVKVDQMIAEGKEDFFENNQEEKQSPPKESPSKVLRTSTSSVSQLNDSPAVIRLPSLGDSPYQPKMKPGAGHIPGLEKSFSACTDSTEFQKFMGSLEQSNPQNFRDFLKLKQLASTNSKEAAETLIFLPVVDIASSDFWPKISLCLKTHLPSTSLKLVPAVTRFLFRLSKETSQVFPQRFFQTFSIALLYFDSKFSELSVAQRIKVAHYFEGSASAFSVHSLRAHQDMVSDLLNELFKFLAKGQELNSVFLYLILEDPECEWLRAFLNRRVFRNICFEFPNSQIRHFFQKCITCFKTTSKRLGSENQGLSLSVPGRKEPLTSEEINMLSLNWNSLLLGSLVLKQQYHGFFKSIFKQNSFNFKAECVSIFKKLLTVQATGFTQKIENLSSSIRNFFIDYIKFYQTLGQPIALSLFSLMISATQSVISRQKSTITLYIYDMVAGILRNDKSNYNVESLHELSHKVLKKLPQEQSIQKVLSKELVVLKALLQKDPKLSHHYIDQMCGLIPLLRKPSTKIIWSTLLSLAQLSPSAIDKILHMKEFNDFVKDKILTRIKRAKELSQLQETALLLCFKGKSQFRTTISAALMAQFLKQTNELDLQFNSVLVFKSSLAAKYLKKFIARSQQIAVSLVKECVVRLKDDNNDIELFKLLSLVLLTLRSYPGLVKLEGLVDRITDLKNSLPKHRSQLGQIVNEILGI